MYTSIKCTYEWTSKFNSDVNLNWIFDKNLDDFNWNVYEMCDVNWIWPWFLTKTIEICDVNWIWPWFLTKTIEMRVLNAVWAKRTLLFDKFTATTCFYFTIGQLSNTLFTAIRLNYFTVISLQFYKILTCFSL